ncbi:hypothetical protein M9H77_28755 [Catharanthus roseus]|uniref:Uncharacterized protein n=2 Tax=Catharanthus roseus TaxID=4058 RepID=A0ACC0AHN8_CATRO|nr:hypothetical protein M9H77_28754 [Catharanthus roseus]KAI5659962.1 hypothetical protein M9H77_28755 [Catharanthus roseus]
MTKGQLTHSYESAPFLFHFTRWIMNEIFRHQLEGDDSFLLSRYRTTKGTGPAPFGSAFVVTKKDSWSNLIVRFSISCCVFANLSANGTVDSQHRCGKGRNARGIITAGHRGGGHKRLYRKIDFRRNEKDIYGRIELVESFSLYGSYRASTCDKVCSFSLHPREGVGQFGYNNRLRHRRSLARSNRFLRQLYRTMSRKPTKPGTSNSILINNLEVWLSGLRHWFAKSTYKKISVLL